MLSLVASKNRALPGREQTAKGTPLGVKKTPTQNPHYDDDEVMLNVLRFQLT